MQARIVKISRSLPTPAPDLARAHDRKRRKIEHEQEHEHDYERKATESAIHPACFSRLD
jgi:hypothetical protein